NLNIVQSYTRDEGKPNGIITRCTAFPTHIDVSQDKKLIAVASSDMTVKVHDTENFKDLTFSGHDAPVLSVALDPKRDFLATSSCDGTVRIWNFRTQTMVRSFPLLSKSNDFSFSTTLCRLCWSIDGQYLFVPVNSEIQVFNRDTWKVEFKLTDSSITGVASIATTSLCGQYIALGCRDGRITVWNIKKRSCIISEKPSKGMAVTGLVWHPKGKEELAFVNSGGEFGTMENFLQGSTVPSSNDEMEKESSSKKEDTNEASTSLFPPMELMDEEEENEISIAKIKSQLGFADDEE
ncbi:UNVERIFIED_CONTAM: hypothetical protein GTU68_034340, partial [Idotea baltica]|nr:hypothetical protein [Idotea baltica]